MPFITKTNFEAMTETLQSLRTLAEAQAQTIGSGREALQAAEQDALDLKTRLDRLRELLANLGVNAAEYEAGTAVWPTYSAKLLSVQITDSPEEVAALLPDATEDTRTQVAMSARRLLSASRPN